MDTTNPTGAIRATVLRWSRQPVYVLALLTCFILSGCGGGSGDPVVNIPTPAPVQETGELTIAITDAEGDFVTYTVDVVSLALEKANGDLVETLPLTTRIDFTELTEVTEFLTIATVPAGNYESVVMTLDYQAAEIYVQDENGDALLATAVDVDGNTLGLFDVRVNLSSSDTIRIAPGAPAAFSLDFDLDASNVIDLAAAVPTVTVEPFLLATAELETDREHRVRGALQSVGQSDFELNVRPFRHRSGSFGTFTVNVNETTQYEVDGVGYTGAEGLTAMTVLPANAPVIANGSISGRSMMGETVLAGSSVPWTDGDVVKGVVAARIGNDLLVRGVRVEYRDGVEVFRGEGAVVLGAGTTVTAPGVDNADLNIDSVSVGQRIVAFGELSDDRTLDASAGRIVMQMNQLTASVVTENPLAVDVYFLNGRQPDVFDFGGTGVDATFDADPTSYDIDTGALSLNGVAGGDLIRVRGLVTAFGSAPDDYAARTIVNVNTESRPGTLRIAWPEGSNMPFHSLSEQMIDVDISESREWLKLRGVPRPFSNPLQSAVLLPPESGDGLYSVKVRGSGELHLYRSFTDLVAELRAQLDSGAVLYRVNANVRYDNADTGFVTPRASFVFKAAGGE